MVVRTEDVVCTEYYHRRVGQEQISVGSGGLAPLHPGCLPYYTQIS
jgi:hypothetical protein